MLAVCGSAELGLRPWGPGEALLGQDIRVGGGLHCLLLLFCPLHAGLEAQGTWWRSGPGSMGSSELTPGSCSI